MDLTCGVEVVMVKMYIDSFLVSTQSVCFTFGNITFIKLLFFSQYQHQVVLAQQICQDLERRLLRLSGGGDIGSGLGGFLVDVFDTPTQNGGGLDANGMTAGDDENYRK